MPFFPHEILFSASTKCNLSCAHCDVKRSDKALPIKPAIKFLEDSNRYGIKRIGFTGGEPFLKTDFMAKVIMTACMAGMTFDRIMTNGVWFKNGRQLTNGLRAIHDAGYDGTICVSVDAFHRQDLKKVASFIGEAVKIWNRPDIVSIASVSGIRERESSKKLRTLAGYLNARHVLVGKRHSYIRGDNVFLKIDRVGLSPIGRAKKLKKPWDGKWFREDYCKGPGNVLFVMPSGDVKPCCGYANELDELTIGNIGRDPVKKIVENVRKNRLVKTIFNSGLTSLRKRMESAGVIFPGKTSSHCYFCHYIATHIPPAILEKALM